MHEAAAVLVGEAVGLAANEETVVAHAGDGAQAVPRFARAQHENQGASIDTDIAVGDEVTVLYPELGAKVNAFTSATITTGEYVCSDGAGGVRVAGSGDSVVGQAAADSDLSGTNGRVEIYVSPLGDIV